MAGVTNIGGGNDKFNRYKMPTLLPKVEGKGNGIKTRIVNLAQIGRSLHRPAGYMCKFFGCELGAQTKIDDENGVYIVNGAHNVKDLGEILTKFIEMFVLCTNCKLPETDLKVKKNGDIVQKCNACGSTGLCDMTHKLCTFITNNPPQGGKGKSKSSKEERRKRKSKKPSLKERDDAANDSAAKERANGSNGSGTTKDTSTVADGVLEQTMLFIPGNDIGDFDNIIADFSGTGEDDDTENVEWSVDTSKEAQDARKQEIGGAAAILDRMTIVDEQEEKGNKVKKLRAYMDDGKKASRVLSKAEKLFGEDHVVAGIMDAVILDETVGTIPKAVESKAVIYLKDIDGVGKPLGLWVDSSCETDSNICKVVAHIFKAFLDEDILSEEEI